METMKKVVIIILTVGLVCGIGFLISAGLTWLGCFALKLLGVAVSFSWKSSFGVWILIFIFNFITKNKRKGE
jgi:hypothetical protein